MGCDIHGFVEVKKNGKWERMTDEVFNIEDTISGPTSEPFYWRSYSTFAFLADVRNYSHVPAIAPYRGLPEDSEYLNEETEHSTGMGNYTTCRKKEIEEDGNYHSCTWLLLKELSEFDYSQEFE